MCVMAENKKLKSKRTGNFKGGRREAATLLWNTKDQYQKHQLKNVSDKELKKEFSRLRSIIRKRIERINKTQFASHETVKYYAKLIENTATQIKKDYKEDPKKQRAVFENLTILFSKAITNPFTSIKVHTERMDKFIKAMHEKNYTFINEDNFLEFMRFMDKARHLGLLSEYDSERALEYFEAQELSGVKPQFLEDEFKEFVAKKDKKIRRYSNPTKESAEYLRKLLKEVRKDESV